jgi:hypothetical protein
MLPTDDEAEFLRYLPIEDWPRASEILLDANAEQPSATDLSPTIKSGYSGIIWGHDGHYAGQWLATLELPTEMSREPRYDRSTRVLGRAGTFAWHGFCQSVIEIRRLNDDTHPGFWSELKLLDTLFTLTTQPEEAFRELSLRGREGTVERIDRSSTDGEPYTLQTIETGGGRFVYRLWTVVLGVRSSRWIYAVTDREEQRTYMWDVFVMKEDILRLAPVERSDVLRAHHDVENILGVAIRDLTELGEWPHQNLHLEKPAALPKKSQLTAYGAATACLTFLASIAMFYRARVNRRSVL